MPAEPTPPKSATKADGAAAEAIERWLAGRLAETLGLPPEEIDPREPFASFGVSSRDLVTLSGELEEWLGRRLSPTLGWEYPTIEALARHLAGPDPDRPAG